MVENKNKITVVVPVYNVEDYLDKCLESIISQTYTNLEILLVDDGSTDKSGIICEKYAQKDQRIKVVHRENGGLSAARNSGINIATGDYITFVDSDDVVSRDMIQYLFSILERAKADMSVCQSRKIGEDGGFIDNVMTAKDITIFGGHEKCLEAYFQLKEFNTVAWGKLYKMSLFETVRYPEGRFHEDIFTTYKLAALSNVVAIGGERKYYYRQREGSIMNRSFSPKHMDAIYGYLQMKEFVEREYPSLKVYAHAGVVYAANMCSLRIARSTDICNEYISQIQSLYRKYEFDFLKGRSRLFSKAFSILAYLDLSLLIKIIRYVGK